MRKLIMGMVGVCLMTQAQAVPCYMTIVKDSCWTAYDVNINIVDVQTEKVLTSMNIPKGKSWVRKEVSCQPSETVMMRATFSPVFWESDKNKSYSARKYGTFPEKPDEGVLAMNLTICFANDFSEVPLPPESSGHCVCDMTNIPAIK